MASENIRRGPGFFEREIDRTQRRQQPVGTPAVVIGTAQRGPAFVPVTVGSMGDFTSWFGDVSPKHPATYAVEQHLKNQGALTYIRVLGAGSNSSLADFELTRTTGRVRNAGFVVTGSADGRGTVQFLAATHDVTADEVRGFPMFTDNNSYSAAGAGGDVNIIRAVIFTADDARLHVADVNQTIPSNPLTLDDLAAPDASGYFKLIIASTDASFGSTDGVAGVRAFTASLDPDDANYVGRVLNTNPRNFATEKHLLYMDLAVDSSVARVVTGSTSVAIMSGSTMTSNASGDKTMPMIDAFGHYDTRFRYPRTPTFISQPYGSKEFDLFHIEARDAGEYAAGRYKVAISNVKKSEDPSSPWATFNVEVRAWDDTDQDPEILEQFTDLTLDPNSDKYIARAIGDKALTYNFDAEDVDDRRLVIDGTFPAQSRYIRVVVSDDVKQGRVPKDAMPFGFRGIPMMKTNPDGVDVAPSSGVRLALSGSSPLSGALVPPVPLRTKVTKGEIDSTTFAGSPGVTEAADRRLYWGVHFERVKDALNPNVNDEKNPLVRSVLKLQGLEGLDVVTTGSLSDNLNDNKFTLARVALSVTSTSQLTGTIDQHMREAMYIRNGAPDSTTYTVSDGVLSGRLTFASLAALTASAEFNRFSQYAKFVAPMYGGFDGYNILDPAAAAFNDRASSTETGGVAAPTYDTPGLNSNPMGLEEENNAIQSYRAAIRIAMDASVVDAHTLYIPGIRDQLVTDFAAERVAEHKLTFYVMDIPSYDRSDNRIFIDDAGPTATPDVSRTRDKFATRAIDNNYVAAYFPDVRIDDVVNNRRVTVPASVAVAAAIAQNDKLGFPWYAPAGFTRGALDFVKGLVVRTNTRDLDMLYDARINPITKFPREGVVVWGQRTLQFANTALNRVNVRRLLIEVKRSVRDVARRLVFEQNDTETRGKFIKQVTARLSTIVLNAGVQAFKVTMDETNNTPEDVAAGILRGRIDIVPVRAAERIAIDFIITNSDVDFSE